MGAKYREPGKRTPIHVGCMGSDYKHLRWAIYRGAGLYDGCVAGEPVKEKNWATEAEAQNYLDLLAKTRNWKKV